MALAMKLLAYRSRVFFGLSGLFWAMPRAVAQAAEAATDAEGSAGATVTVGNDLLAQSLLHGVAFATALLALGLVWKLRRVARGKA